MAVLLIDQASVRGGGGLAVHQPMGAGHEQALAQLAREFECSDSHTESLASSITLDDGDLSWHSGDGHDILFTAVDVAGTLVSERWRDRRTGGLPSQTDSSTRAMPPAPHTQSGN